MWTFAVAVAACTVLAAVWTFEFSLPVAMALDGNATPAAERALLQVQHGPLSPRGLPLHPCTTVETGSIGPLEAPYQECALSNPEIQVVRYSVTSAGGVRGLVYTDIGAAAFPDQCFRHLVGQWWMFVGDASAIGCPWGYTFHGGP
jgi:hypothetical protein